MNPPPVHRFHSSQSRSDLSLTNTTSIKKTKTALGSFSTSPNPSYTFPYKNFNGSYACWSANTTPGIFHSALCSLSVTKFNYPLNTPLSKTWLYGKWILRGLCRKGNPGISHSGPFSAVTETFWLQVNKRIPEDLPHFLLLWSLFLCIGFDQYLNSATHSFVALIFSHHRGGHA